MTVVMREELDRVVEELRSEGRRAMKIDPWAPPIALSYVDMAVELDEQCDARGIEPTRVWLAAAGPTQSGLELGAKLLGWRADITGIAPLTWTGADLPDLTADAANRAAELLGADERVSPADVDNRTDFIGPGYARSSAESLAAMRLAARTDALLLDPVYTSKAMAGLIDAVRRGELTPADTVVFVHTGGLPAVFAYRDTILAMSRSTEGDLR